MNLGRRQVIRVALVGGATSIIGVPLDALAYPVRPEQVGFLAMAFDFLWDNVLEPAIISLQGLVQQAVVNVGRQFIINSEGRGAGGGGRAAVTMSVHKNAAAFSFTATCSTAMAKSPRVTTARRPSHTHPAMRRARRNNRRSSPHLAACTWSVAVVIPNVLPPKSAKDLEGASA